MLSNTLAVILAGDPGASLMPLTAERAKAALPFGGKYRIVDFALTNCLHSGARRVLVLTQYKSHSLHKHLRNGWSIFNPELGEYITTVPPQMRTGERWYGGTADAIYQNLYLLKRSGAEFALVLTGDHVYRMDYAALLAFHQSRGSEITVGCVDAALCHDGGVMRAMVDDESRIQSLSVSAAPPVDGSDGLVPMGVYVFSVKRLLDALEEDHAQQDSAHDLCRDVLPRLVSGGQTFAYRFGGAAGRVSRDCYWCDVQTIDMYYEANMALLKPAPPLDLYQADWPIRSYQQQTPPARTVPGYLGNEGIFINSIVGGGTVIAGGSVQSSLLFSNCAIGDHAFVEDAILFEGAQIGHGARLRNCILDKDVTVPDGESIGYDAALDRSRFHVSERGRVVVPKNYRFDND